MPLPDIREFCVDIDVTPGDLCLTFPGGVEVCAHFPSLVPPSPDELVRQLFAQLNSALAPMQPVFNIIDAVLAVFDCIKAISTLDPQKIVECIPNLAEKIARLLQLIPQLSLPALVVQFLDVLILYLRGQLNQLRRQEAYMTRILAAELAATTPGLAGLLSVVACARADVDAMLSWYNQSAAPVNRLVGIINAFMEIIGLGKYAIPPLEAFDPGSIGSSAGALETTIEFLTSLRAAVAPIVGQVAGPFEDAASQV